MPGPPERELAATPGHRAPRAPPVHLEGDRQAQAPLLHPLPQGPGEKVGPGQVQSILALFVTLRFDV